MDALLWAFRIAVIALGAFGLVVWLPALCYYIYRWPREQERWQLKVSLILVGITKVMLPVLFLLIGFGARHVARDCALFVVLPVLVVSTLRAWFIKWRFPEYRTSISAIRPVSGLHRVSVLTIPNPR